MILTLEVVVSFFFFFNVFINVIIARVKIELIMIYRIDEG